MHRTRPLAPVLVVLGGLLGATVATPFALTACTSTSASPLATDAALIDTGLSIIAPVILASKGITPAEVNAINAGLATIHSAAAALSGGASMTQQQAIIAGVQAVADVAAKYLPVGSQEALAVIAATRLIPLFLPAGTVAATPAPGMTIAEARARLAAVRR